jgi:hypothetical protein
LLILVREFEMLACLQIGLLQIAYQINLRNRRFYGPARFHEIDDGVDSQLGAIDENDEDAV